MSIAETPATHGQRRQAIVDSLLRDVFHGRLRAGQHLVTRELADRFGVSHTPIREALISLAGIGVVDLQPNRGAIVRRVTAREIEEVCHVRRALECEAVRAACDRIDPRALRALAEDLRRLTEVGPAEQEFVEAARETDNRLHDLIAASSGNAFLAAELSRLQFLFRAFRDISWEHQEARNDLRRIAEEGHEHLAIVEALLAGKRQEAVKAMARHINAGIRYWSRALGRPGEAHSLVSSAINLWRDQQDQETPGSCLFVDLERSEAHKWLHSVDPVNSIQNSEP